MKELGYKVDFSIIRYANCWEDPCVLLDGLQARKDERILSIASAGDNTFSLLMTDPEIIVAADISEVQLHLVELKMAAIKLLQREGFLEFAGFLHSGNRLKVFDEMKGGLSPQCRNYWARHRDWIERGIIYSGKFEKYFSMFSRRILPLMHGKERVEGLLTAKDGSAQEEFYKRHWNNRRWRFFFRIFFSRFVMGTCGRDPEFLKEVRVPVSQFIFEQSERHLSSTACQENFILRFNLTGNFGSWLPHYVQPGNYEKIKAGIDRIRLFRGYASHAIAEFGKFERMNLSNIFEYMDPATFRNVSADLVRGLETNGRMAYWNLMVPRRISAENASVNYLDQLSDRLKEKDKGFFYSKFIVEEKINSGKNRL